MSTLLEQASLVLIPSGYKEDTVYSVIPSNGSGDLSFTRASDGTRINSDGLVEVTPLNLVTYSEDFSNVAWTKQNSIAVTANTTTAPNGTLTADTLEKASGSGGSNYYYIVNSTNSFEQLTNFFYVKYKSGSGIVWLLGKNSGSFAFYDVINGTALSATSGMTTSIENVGNGWYKCIFSQTYVGAANNTFGVGLCLVNGTPNYDATTAPTQSAYIWGSQSNIGSTAKPYFPTTDRLNVPRLTYQNGGGGCPSLLLEPQRTNVCLYSEQFDNVNWSKQGATITANSIVSPDGTQNADTIIEDSANSLHRIISAGISTTNGIYTASAFIKKGTRRYVILSVVQGFDSIYVCIDTDNSTITQSSSSGTYVYSTSSVINLTNGWIRCTLTGTITIGAVLSVALSNTATPNNASFQYTGNGSYAYAWGAQLEAGSYASSYIPTTSASATRIADACSKTGISSLIGGTSGTVFFDIKTNPTLSSASYKQFCYYFDSANAQSYMYLNSANQITTNVNWGSLFLFTALLPNTRYKIALVYAPNDFALYINGVSVATALSGIPKDNERISIGQLTGSENAEFVFNQYTHFKTRLTNSELALITTI
jgi:hypothetical protein